MEREQKLSMKVQAWRTCSKWDRVSNMKQLLIERMGVVEVTCNIHIIYYLLVFLEVFGEKNTQSNRNNIKNNYFKSFIKNSPAKVIIITYWINIKTSTKCCGIYQS